MEKTLNIYIKEIRDQIAQEIERDNWRLCSYNQKTKGRSRTKERGDCNASNQSGGIKKY